MLYATELVVVTYTSTQYTSDSPVHVCLTYTQAGRLEAQLKASQVEKEHARQDAEKAQTRVETAHEAWQGLAEKVVSLADRNADLERVRNNSWS